MSEKPIAEDFAAIAEGLRNIEEEKACVRRGEGHGQIDLAKFSRDLANAGKSKLTTPIPSSCNTCRGYGTCPSGFCGSCNGLGFKYDKPGFAANCPKACMQGAPCVLCGGSGMVLVEMQTDPFPSPWPPVRPVPVPAIPVMPMPVPPIALGIKCPICAGTGAVPDPGVLGGTRNCIMCSGAGRI